MTSLERIFDDLSAELNQQNVEAILLSSDQIFVRKHLVPRSGPAGFKTPELVPAADGYAIYVRSRLPGAKARPEQRIRPRAKPVRWDAATMTLRLNRDSLDQSWELLNQAAESISISVHSGSEAVFDEVDRILVVIAGKIDRT